MPTISPILRKGRAKENVGVNSMTEKQDKALNWVILILIILIMLTSISIFYDMPATAQAHYNELESKTTQAIERARVRAIIGGVDV